MIKQSLKVDWPTFWGAVWFILLGSGFAGFGGYQVFTTWQFRDNAAKLPALIGIWLLFTKVFRRENAGESS